MSAPFTSDYEFIEATFDLLTCRAQRTAAAREIREAALRESGGARTVGRSHSVTNDDAARRVEVLTEREQRLGLDLETRRAAHKAAPETKPLGIDRLAEAHGLGEDEQLIVLACLCCALSEERAEAIHAGLGTGMYGSHTVEGLTRLLDAQTVEDRIRVRRLFRPDAPLVKDNCIVLDYYGTEALPDDLLSARVKITSETFNVLLSEA